MNDDQHARALMKLLIAHAAADYPDLEFKRQGQIGKSGIGNPFLTYQIVGRARDLDRRAIKRARIVEGEDSADVDRILRRTVILMISAWDRESESYDSISGIIEKVQQYFMTAAAPDQMIAAGFTAATTGESRNMPETEIGGRIEHGISFDVSLARFETATERIESIESFEAAITADGTEETVAA